MTIDIYSILKSKSKNEHQLNRYFKFINSCREKNKELKKYDYVENHHICPKANDLFPEYKNCNWNFINLTARQHIIAHIILWKIFGGSQAIALECMLDNFCNLTNSKLCERIPTFAIRNRYLANARKEAALVKGTHHKGKQTYKDYKGKKYYLYTTDPLIEELGLVGYNKGYKHSDESKKKMSKSRSLNLAPHLQIELFMLNCEPIKKKLSDEGFVNWFEDFTSQGWSLEKTEFDIVYIKRMKSEEHSSFMKDKMRYVNEDGLFMGWFKKEDLIIKEQNLKPQYTDLNRELLKEFQKKGQEALKGSNTYNNGKIEIKKKQHPGEGWTLGRLPRSESHKEAQRKALCEKVSGTTYWNDGIKNFRLKPNEIPDSSWKKGMKPRIKM